MRKVNKTKRTQKKNSSLYKIRNKQRKPFFLSRWAGGLFNLFSDFHLKRKTKRELNAVILLFLSGIVILSLFNTAGMVGDWLKGLITRTFGAGSVILPLVFIGVAARLFMIQDSKEEGSSKDKDYSLFRLYLGSFLFIAAILGIFHINVPWEELKHVANQGENGGYVGFTVNFFLRPLFSTIGSLFVMVFLAVFSIQLAFELSWKDIFIYLYKFFITKKDDRIRVVVSRSKEKKIETKPFQRKEKEGEIKKVKDTSFTINKLSSKMGDYKLPKLDLLDFEPFSVHVDLDEIIENKQIIKKTFSDFNINIFLGNESVTGELVFKDKENIMQGVSIGPTVTQYSFKPEAGVKLAKISGLQNDLALSLAAQSLRIEAPIPGKSLVGVEIPNDKRSVVKMGAFFNSDEFKSIDSTLKLNIGRDVAGKAIVADLAKMPHLLVAGATGSGKSVCINSFIISLLYQNSPDMLKFIMVDPKRVELSIYNGIPHLLAPVITDPQKTVAALRWAVAEMDRRYRLLSEKGYKNIADFNKGESKGDRLPYIVILIDELADLMMVASKEVEGLICRLAQMARAIGIHLIVATQRPSVDVITGLIKANIPARIAFTVSSGVDSKTILDSVGAERLLGMGDMLYVSSDNNNPRRIQGIFLTSHEIRKVANFVKSVGEPDYDNQITDKDPRERSSDQLSEVKTTVSTEASQLNLDSNNSVKIPGVDNYNSNSSSNSSDDNELMVEAMKVIIENKKASASFLQRRMRLGYARASRIIDLLEDTGFIGAQDGSKPRNILISQEQLDSFVEERNNT